LGLPWPAQRAGCLWGAGGHKHSALTNQAFLLVMMIGGAVGFYLGQSIRRSRPSAHRTSRPADGAWVGKIDTRNCSARSALPRGVLGVACVGVIVRATIRIWHGYDDHGRMGGRRRMQIVAGTIARLRR